MVIYTPRLCNDVTFLPPRDNKANAISCREVMDKKQREEYYKRRAEAEVDQALLEDAQEQSQQGQEEEQEQQVSDAAAETAIKNPDKRKKDKEKEKEKKKKVDEKAADGIEELLHILQQEL